ncbi:MAG TPA: TolC family protein [Candidatus Latescibacteria bacterium]|nr:TolC family protein [Candidatus Latescibacterota bacterium]HOF60772.1 TolC family protein [Candidatus Latescibacterota bacterium]HOS64839.1 TolC family protein [Candidatus Latescibacterota bacterium]HOT36382.1 TolC family protein [Candidatus Latescibacterota bacterium]HPC44947.1 TolC family protein [Candidatus Latescibacterota bacterium]
MLESIGRTGKVCAFWIVCSMALVSGAGARGISLREAEQMALERNPQIAGAKASLDSARAGITRARATILPSLAATAGYTWNAELPVVVMPAPVGAVSIGEKHNYSLALTARQPVFLGFAGVTGVRMAETALQSSQLRLDATTQTVIASVREAYLAAVLSRMLVTVNEQAVAQAESSLALVQRRADVGSASRFDLLRARVQLATLRPNLTSARSNRDLADGRLRLAIGVGERDAITPSDTLAVFASEWAKVPLDSLRRIAREQRTEIRQLDIGEQISNDAVTLSRSAYYPTVAAFATSQWEAQRPSLSVSSGDFRRVSMLGLQLNWTFWDSWKTPATVQMARVGVRQLNLFRQLATDGISLEVEAAFHGLHEAELNLATGLETVNQAAEALRLASVMYSEGGNTQLDVISAQLALTSARTQYAQALYNYHVAHIRMEKALGLTRVSQD